MPMEVYYEHYAENCRDRYWEKEEKSIPYMVLFPSNEEMQAFILKLKNQGYRCVSNNSDYRALLVNTELRRCAIITKACKHSCIDDRNYTPEEFEREVLQMEHYRIFISDPGGFRDSSTYEFVAEFANQKAAANYVSYMGGKSRYRGKDIIIKKIDISDIDAKAGKVDGVISAIGEELHVEEYDFT